MMRSVVNCTADMPFFLEKSGAVQYYRFAAFDAAAAIGIDIDDDDDHVSCNNNCGYGGAHAFSGSTFHGGAGTRVMGHLLQSKSAPSRLNLQRPLSSFCNPPLSSTLSLAIQPLAQMLTDSLHSLFL
jgi:hypothetical protein